MVMGSQYESSGFKPALNSKGLRRRAGGLVAWTHALQASPEFKGIKTTFLDSFCNRKLLQASPEFKGIKTENHLPVDSTHRASSQP